MTGTVDGWGADNARAIFGALGVITFAWALGGFRRPPIRLVLSALGLQVALAFALFGLPPMRAAVLSLAGVVQAIQNATRAGTAFVFGYVGGAESPFPVAEPGALVTLAFQLLPIIMVISAISAVLWHWRVLQLVCSGFAVVFRRLLGLSGAASLGVAANIFMGMVEAPILVRPHVPAMTRTELFTLMSAGLATVAGTVLVIYATMLEPILPGAIAHIVAASIMNAPAAILVARLMVPDEPGGATRAAETTVPQAAAQADDVRHASTIDALVTGVGDGLRLYLNVIAMLLVFVALVALANGMLDAIPDVAGAPLSVERMFGWVFQPITWAIGIPWEESGIAGSLYGIKTVLTEFIAYERLTAVGELISPRTRLIMTYALCGFANFGALGIMLAGLVTMAPERRADILELGPRSLVAGSLATLLTGAIVAAMPAGLFGI